LAPSSDRTASPLAIGPVPLVSELDGRPVRTTPAAVMVRLAPRTRLYDVRASIQFLSPPGFGLRPSFPSDGGSGELTIRLLGPEQSAAPKVVCYIDLTQGNFVAGLNHAEVRLQLPRDFHLAQAPPRPVAFVLAPPSPLPE
jgi:hypothetical protein